MIGGSVEEKLLVCDGWWLGGGEADGWCVMAGDWVDEVLLVRIAGG